MQLRHDIPHTFTQLYVVMYPPVKPTPPHLYRKSLNREYELNMLTEGDFDERVFLHHNASEEIGTPTRQPMGAYQLMVTMTTLVWCNTVGALILHQICEGTKWQPQQTLFCPQGLALQTPDSSTYPSRVFSNHAS